MAVMTRLMVMVALMVIYAVPCLGAAPQAITKGFGTVAWGEDVSKRQGFLKIRTDDGIDYFVSLRENYEMKGFGKPTVFYGLSGGKLYAVHLRLKDATGYDELTAELRKIYGPGKKAVEGDSTVIRWKKGPVRVKLKKDQAGGMKLAFYYLPVASSLSLTQREADLASEDLAQLLPAGEAQVTAPGSGAMPPKQEDKVGIDVLKYLREGSTLLKLDVRK
ncbi:MAG: hypothetical protein HY795_09035 [Desulfovibrio sp.]|nr:hypothetical protein [Desulfovibrio sp.]MBI4958559.1 hypothetical protein [Desulfovibrio sp.]